MTGSVNEPDGALFAHDDVISHVPLDLLQSQSIDSLTLLQL